MKTIQDLPNEVLLNIFRLGCENPPDSPAHPVIPHTRKRKQIIAVARLVCFQWQQLVDLRGLPYGDHFWLAQLSLSLRRAVGDQYDRKLATPNVFLRRLIKFRKLLSTSLGCDLWVDLDTGGKFKESPFKWKRPKGFNPEVLSEDESDSEASDDTARPSLASPNPFDRYRNAPPEEQLLIKLFLSGAFEILQQKNQILAIRVKVAQGFLHKPIVELLAGLESAPRLKLIQVSLPHLGAAHPHLRNLASLTSIPGFDVLNPRALKPQERWGNSLAKLAHLDVLSVPLFWLQDLDHHLTIWRLHLWAEAGPPQSVYVTIFSQSPLCENLRELHIWWLPGRSDPFLEPGDNCGYIPTISFAHLRHLKLELIPNYQAYWFLSLISCPQLTNARLGIWSYPQFLTRSKWSATEQNRFPRLADIQIEIKKLDSPDSLHLLDMFKHSPVRQLAISGIQAHWPSTYNMSGHRMTKVVMGILSHFKPDAIQIKDIDLPSAFIIMEGLNRHRLRNASISTYAASLLDPSALARGDLRIISLPLLSTLVLDVGSYITLINLFQQINVEALVSLDLNTKQAAFNQLIDAEQLLSCVSMENREAEILVPSFPCLRCMTVRGRWKAQIRDPLLHTLWEKSPKLADLQFILTDWHSSTSTLPTVCGLILSLLDPVYSWDTGRDVDLLPSLSLLNVNWRINEQPRHFREGKPRPRPSIITVEEVEASRLAIVNGLVSRHGKGAVRLELTDFGHDYKKKELRFRAVKNNGGRAGGSMTSPHR
jgi:hypothetical protein